MSTWTSPLGNTYGPDTESGSGYKSLLASLPADIQAGAPRQAPPDNRNLFQKALGAALDNPVGRAVTTTLSLLDIPRSMTLSTLVELHDVFTDPEGWEQDDWAEQAFASYGVGDRGANLGVGDLLADADIPHWAKVVGGFAGDVATDPLTYVTAGTAKLGGGAARLADEAIEGLAKGGARVGAKRVNRGMIFRDQVLDVIHDDKVWEPLVARYGQDAVEEVAERVARQKSAAPLRELPELDNILQETLGGGLRTGVSLGAGKYRVFLGGQRTADAFSQFTSRLKDKTVRKWLPDDPRFEITKGKRHLKKATDTDTPYLNAYRWERANRGANMARTIFRSRMDDKLNELDAYLDDVDEAAVIQRIETTDLDDLRDAASKAGAAPEDVSAFRIAEFLDEAANTFDQVTGTKMPRYDRFFPHQQTEDFQALLAEGHRVNLPQRRWGNVANRMERKYKKGDKWLGEELQEGGIDEMHRIARNVIGEDYVDVFSTKLRPVLRKYAHDMSNAARWDAFNTHLEKLGLVKELGTDFNRYVSRVNRETLRDNLGERVRRNATREATGTDTPRVRAAMDEASRAAADVADAAQAAAVRQAVDADAIRRAIGDDTVSEAVEAVEETVEEALVEVGGSSGRPVAELEARLSQAVDEVEAIKADLDAAAGARAAEGKAQAAAQADVAAAQQRIRAAEERLEFVSRQAQNAEDRVENWRLRQAAAAEAKPSKAEAKLRDDYAEWAVESTEIDRAWQAARDQVDRSRQAARAANEAYNDLKTGRTAARKAAAAEEVAGTPIPKTKTGNKLADGEQALRSSGVLGGGLDPAEQQRLADNLMAGFAKEGTDDTVRIIDFDEISQYGKRVIAEDTNDVYAVTFKHDGDYYIGVKRTRSGKTPALAIYHEMAHVMHMVNNRGRAGGHRRGWENLYVDMVTEADPEVGAVLGRFRDAETVEEVEEVWRDFKGAPRTKQTAEEAATEEALKVHNAAMKQLTDAEMELSQVKARAATVRGKGEKLRESAQEMGVDLDADAVRTAADLPYMNPKGAKQFAERKAQARKEFKQSQRELETAEAKVIEQSRQADELAGAEEAHITRLNQEILELESDLANRTIRKVERVKKQKIKQHIEKAKDLTEKSIEEPDPDMARMARLEAVAEESQARLDEEVSAAAARAEKASEYRARAEWMRDNMDAVYDAYEAGFRHHVKGKWMLPETHEAYRRLREIREIEPIALLRWMDGITARWKGWALVSPGFHIRNFQGGFFNNLLDSVKLSSYGKFSRAYRQWRKTLRANGGYKGGASLYDALDGIKDGEVRAIFREMLDGADFLRPQGNALSQNVRDQADLIDLATRGGKEGLAARTARRLGRDIDHLGRSLDPTDMEFGLLQANFMAAGGVERMLRGTQYLDNRLRGLPSDVAWDKVRMFHFNYDELSDFERRWMRRIVPFYTWTRKNFPLQLEMMFRKPGIYNAVNHFRRNIALGVEEDEVVPAYYEELMAAATPFTVGPGGLVPEFNLDEPTGDDARLYATLDLPFRDLAKTLDPGNIVGMSNPILKTALEVSAGKTYFNDVPFSDYLQPAPDYGPLSDTFYTVLEQMNGAFGLPRVAKDDDGEWVWRAVDQYKVESMLPMVGRVHRLSGIIPGVEGKETYENRSLQYTLSTMFGISTATNDPTAQRGERIRRDKALEDAIARARGEKL